MFLPGLGFYRNNKKGKVPPITGHECPRREVEVWLYSFFNPVARWGGWLTPRSGRFTPGKETLYPLYRRLGGPQGRSKRVRKMFPPPSGIRSPNHPARSESLYQLSYPGPHRNNTVFIIWRCWGFSRILGPKRDEVTGEWSRLHNKELYALCSSPNIVIKSRRGM
jgi:hypothetical protein